MACLLIYLYNAVSTRQSRQGHFQQPGRSIRYIKVWGILVKRVSAYTVKKG
jgi:hypothetical protein